MKPLIRNFIPGKDSLNTFDCGKPDLKNFLLETGDDTPNATKYEREHLSKTYIVEDQETHQMLAYFSLACDKFLTPKGGLPIRQSKLDVWLYLRMPRTAVWDR